MLNYQAIQELATLKINVSYQHVCVCGNHLTQNSSKVINQLEVIDANWCWCSAPGDLIIPADSLSTSLGIGLSVTL